MIKRDTLIEFLDKYFDPYRDLAAQNEMVVSGVQIVGGEKVRKVGLGVSGTLKFFKEAKEKGADFLIVHHGLGIHKQVAGNIPNALLQGRLRFLYQNDLTLAGYHFALDYHPKIGNNTWVLSKLGAKPLGNIHGYWGWYGDLLGARPQKEIVSFLESFYGHTAKTLGPLKDKVKRVAVVSGGGGPDADLVTEFLEKKIDLLITGELKESHFGIAEEIDLAVAAFGHYNTEKVGVANLGEVIKKQFPDLAVEFIDVPNEL